ncbi:hypothetical protein [Hyphomicrobium sp. DY-1]|uniref:hypothetical protein n=1 Tax=Hyphomicrobium sp. DY-1 TaxID=3075650 RepID=UPI0039C1B1F5
MSVVASGYNLEDPAEFKAWCVHYPKAAALLASVIRSWKTSKAKLRDDPHVWAAYPLRVWCQWTGLKLRTLERYLAFLEVHGLIRRERGPFAGNTLHTFIRPTRRALAHYQFQKTPKSKTSKFENSKSKKVTDPVAYVDAWECAVVKHTDAAYCKLTKSARYQLKEAVDAMPPEHVSSIIEYSVERWNWFGGHVKYVTEEFTHSPTPSTAFFKKHVNVFINVYMNSLKVQATKSNSVKSSSSQKSEIDVCTDEYIDSLED